MKRTTVPSTRSAAVIHAATIQGAYLRHLMKANEMLGMRLGVIHNLYFYNNLTAKIREALDEGRFTQYKNSVIETLSTRI